MIHKEFKQGSPEWFEYRRGKITASHIIDIMPGPKGYRKERGNYMSRLACERLTGTIQPTFTNAAMEHGTETEPFARAAYEARYGELVEEVGFIDFDDNSGASPDGLVKNGGLEIKCPNTATHIETLRTGKIKRDYILQMQFNMMCADAKWWDFVSFDDRMPEHAQLIIIRNMYDLKLAEEIKTELEKFTAELLTLVEEIKNYRG